MNTLPAAAAAVALLAAAWPAGAQVAASVDEARATVARWAETRRLIHEEAEAWEQEEEILESRVALIETEVEGIRRDLAESRKAGAEQSSRRSSITDERDRLQAVARSLAERALALEAEVRRLRSQLPQPVQEKVAPLYQRIPADSSATSVSVAERFQNVLGILGEAAKANTEITLATEIRPLSDGTPSEVKTVYVGLAQAYYVSARGEAGVGRPGASGWTWEPDASIAPQVTEVIRILQDKATPRFVPLPVRVQ